MLSNYLKITSGGFAFRSARIAFLAVAFFGVIQGSSFADTLYVDINNNNPVAPYISWESAAT
jgi:hypothetical protein